MKSQETNSANPPDKKEVVDQTIGLFDHIISYFEILAIYGYKLANEKIRKTAILFISITILTFLEIIGFGLLFFAIYSKLLELFNQSHFYTSLTLGSAILLITTILLKRILNQFK